MSDSSTHKLTAKLQVKRSKSINLDRMRKRPAAEKPHLSTQSTLKKWALKTGLLGSGLLLTGCSEKANWYETVDECEIDSLCSEHCETAYQQAKKEANQSGPRYRSERECEHEFGYSFCVPTLNDKYRPKMAGFMMPDFDDCDDDDYRYYGRSLFWPRGRFSKNKNKLFSSRGQVMGSTFNKKLNITKQGFNTKLSSPKTVSRGGFGSTSSRSSFGSSSSSRRSWGG